MRAVVYNSTNSDIIIKDGVRGSGVHLLKTKGIPAAECFRRDLHWR